MALSNNDGIPEPKGKIIQVVPGTIVACRRMGCGGLAVPVGDAAKVDIVYRIALTKDGLPERDNCNLRLKRIPQGFRFCPVEHLIHLQSHVKPKAASTRDIGARALRYSLIQQT